MLSSERPTPAALEALGLDESDLESFGPEAPREEGDLADEPVLDGEETASAAQATPAASPTDATPASPAPSEPATPAPAASAAPATTASAPPSAPSATPWTFTADGSRITLGHATADGSVVFGADELPVLQRHLADRNKWRERERGFQAQIADLTERADPSKNEAVVLSTLLARDMVAARNQGEEALYNFVVGFFNELPRLQAEARAIALTEENKRLQNRVTPIDREQRSQEEEPTLRAGVEQYLDQYLNTRYPDLKPLRQQLVERLWKAKDRVLTRADRDYPDDGVQKGQWAVQFGAMEDLLDAAQLAIASSKGAVDRAGAAARNAATLAAIKAPPAPGVQGSPVPDRDQRPAPKSKAEYQDRIDELAGGRRAR